MHRRLRLNCFNTQPPEGGWRGVGYGIDPQTKFQHTAARRRLGRLVLHQKTRQQRFNTQPPEGGWAEGVKQIGERKCFNTQPPEGGW